MDTKGELKLWRSVIIQALRDALRATDQQMDSHASEAAYVRHMSRYWLEYAPLDYFEVCYMADIDPSWFRKQVVEPLISGKYTLTQLQKLERKLMHNAVTDRRGEKMRKKHK